LGEILGPIARLSFGTLYPALNRLEQMGAVAVLAVTESRTGLTTARGRKVYGITDRGHGVFGEQLESEGTTDDDKAFAFRLAFAQHLPVEARLRFLLRRREQLAARASEARRSLAAREKTVDDYGRSLMEHSAEVAQNDIVWLDRLIERERVQAPDR